MTFNKPKFFLLIALATLAGGTVYFFTNTKKSEMMSSRKWDVLHNSSQRQSQKVLGKAKGNVLVQIEAIKTHSDSVELVGTIFPQKDIADLHIEWQLPQGFSLIEGQEFEIIPQAFKGKKLQSFITVDITNSPSSQNATTIRLHAYQKAQDENMGAITQYIINPTGEKELSIQEKPGSQQQHQPSQAPKHPHPHKFKRVYH